jgi:hypothetical protein
MISGIRAAPIQQRCAYHIFRCRSFVRAQAVSSMVTTDAKKEEDAPSCFYDMGPNTLR